MARPRLRRRDRQADPTGSAARSTPEGGAEDARDADTPPGTTLTEVADDVPPPPPAVPRRRVLDATPLLLLRAAHPRQAVATAVLMAVAAALADRPTRDLGLVLGTVLVGQALLGWHNDLVDRRRDARHGRTDKPVADGRLDPSTAWFALSCAVLLVIPLALSNGITAGLLYLVSLAIGVLGNYTLRTGFLSWVPWAAAFALYPAFLSFGGWGNHDGGAAPQPAMTVLAALLGIGVHLLTSLWGLVADHEDGWTYLPLRLGMKVGAARLLALTATYLALVTAGMIITGTLVGLHA
ncbi:UbiA family prenyltransferase [Nocardioides sp. REDSEA-S30_B4]|jgi:4-hydroxybenzoate polyprenyltransferase|uniref:UbiA family prenyltransferase n=1 Tax=Nocardioides sp. REDSEA-S30_B4 TaxID=1811552 RepID=UPI000A70F41F|nr:UbiA family prenyltransferase [Nocardioides sp. REDSEA-S30_B4]